MLPMACIFPTSLLVPISLILIWEPLLIIWSPLSENCGGFEVGSNFISRGMSWLVRRNVVKQSSGTYMARHEDGKRADFGEESHLIDRAHNSVNLSGENSAVS
jgi:hypothetical protein